MSLPREQKKSQLPWGDLAIFAGALLFLGVSLHSFLGSHETARTALPAKLTDAKSASLLRAPASQSPVTTTLTTEVLHLPCLGENTRKVFSSSARLMQIHSPLCNGDAKSTAPWRATNESSGEEILVFVNYKERHLSTSYFNLKEGRNDLVFEQDLGRGHTRRETLQVTRLAE